MNNVYVIGSSFYDEFKVLVNEKYTEFNKLGGVYNIDVGLKIPINYNSTNFLINDHGESKKIEWDYATVNPSHLLKDAINTVKMHGEADWIHFSYLNTIPEYNFNVRDFPAKIVSCDLSKEKHPGCYDERVLENAIACDFIFSGEQISYELGKIIDEYDKYFIYHHKSGGYIQQGKKMLHTVWHEVFDFKFTVGAGDKLAGYFIDAQLRGNTLQRSHEIAHEKVVAWLKEQNEKI